MKKFVSSLIIISVFITHNGLANDAKKLIKNNGCLACHSVKLKVFGPSFIDIANKYENNNSNQQILVQKIKKGGSGNWGNIPMMSHPNITNDELNLMVRWILDL
jgi:cytochrome c